MTKRKAKSKNPSRAKSTGAAGKPSGAFSAPPWIWWLLPTLTVFAVMPGMMSGNFTPKTFWASSTTALGLIMCRRRKPSALGITALGGIWAAFMLWALLSLAWGMQARVGLERWASLLLPTLAYFLALRTRFWRYDGFWQAYAAIFFIFSLIGCLQYLVRENQSKFIYDLVQWFPGGEQRPRVTVGHRNYAGLYLTVSIPLMLAAVMRFKGRMRWLIAGALFLGMLLMLFLRARQSWLGLAAALLFMAATGVFQLRRLGRRSLYGIAALFLLAVAASAVIKPPASMSTNKRTLLGTVVSIWTEKKVNPRIAMWDFTLSVPISRVWGGGFGSFPMRGTPYTRDNRVLTLNWEVHDDYIQTIIDLGAVGLALLLIFYGIALRLSWRQRDRPLCAAAGASLVGLATVQLFDFTSEKVSTLVWMAGLMAILNAAPSRWLRRRARAERWIPKALNFAAAAYLFIFACIVGATIHADRLFGLEARRLRIQRTSRDYPYLIKEVLPWMLFDANMVHFTANQLALVSFSERDFDSARIFAAKALSLQPSDHQMMMVLAETDMNAGRTAEAAAEYERILALLGPRSDLTFPGRLEEIYRLRGDKLKAQALEARLRSVRMPMPLNPDPPNFSTGIENVAELSWEPVLNADFYNIFLWREGEEMPSSPAVFSCKTPKVGMDKKLDAGTAYLWRIEAKGKAGVVRGPIWTFRTAKDAKIGGKS